MMLNNFSCCPSLCHFWKNVFRSSAHFLIRFFLLLLDCMNSLHILYINPLLNVRLENTFSHSIGCLFILMMVSLALEVRAMETLLRPTSRGLPTMFSPRNYVFSGLLSKNLNRFELIYLYKG